MDNSMYETYPANTLAVVDLFCGAGGMAHGFLLEGYKVAGGLDVDPDCRYAFEHNNESTMLLKDIEETTPQEIADLFPENATRILVGCAPCQPYSRYSIKHVKNRGKDIKWKLVPKFAEIVEEIRPQIVSMENVVGLMEFDDGKVLNDFIDVLKRNEYYVSINIVFCPDYGIPQNRRRLVILASQLGEIDLIPPTHGENHYRTVRDAIGQLNPIAAGEQDPNDRLHKARSLDETNLKRIRQSLQGGTWADWPEDLKLVCHKKEAGGSFKNVYGRMKWTEPSPTITTQFNNFGTGRFGHPEQDRALSLREGAILQTFPQDFEFVPPNEPVIHSRIARLIGNAVPVDLGRVVARSILAHMEKFA